MYSRFTCVVQVLAVDIPEPKIIEHEWFITLLNPPNIDEKATELPILLLLPFRIDP